MSRLLDWLWPPLPGTARYERKEHADATQRWRQINAEKRAAGCPCGKPATRVRYNHGNVGAVPVEFWTCDEHDGMSGWSAGPSGFIAVWPRRAPCSDCDGYCSTTRKIGASVPYEWHCPLKREAGERHVLPVDAALEEKPHG